MLIYIFRSQIYDLTHDNYLFFSILNLSVGRKLIGKGEKHINTFQKPPQGFMSE